MTPLSKASPLSGLPELDPPASNTDETKSMEVSHVKHPEDQPVIDLITRRVKTWNRSAASQRGWRTRKRIAAARARMGLEP
jgi:hypothetical protein